MKLTINASEKTEWLIVFLVLDTNEFTIILDNFSEELKAIKLNKKTKVYFLIDSVHRIRDPRRYPLSLKIREFVYDEGKQETLPHSIDLEDVNEQDGPAWLEAFGQIYEKTNARFSTLITWSHGSGLGILNMKHPAPKNAMTPPVVPGFKWDYDQCDKLNHLFISEMGKDLEKLTKERKIDLVIMCNCVNQVADNNYNLRNVANYYFAPIGGIHPNGYDFVDLISYLNGTRDSLSLADRIGDLLIKRLGDSALGRYVYPIYLKKIIRNLFLGYKRKQPAEYDNHAFVATRLVRVSVMPKLLNPICEYFIRTSERSYPVILDIITHKIQTLSEDSVYLFDAISLFELVQKELKDEELGLHVSRFKKFVLRDVFAAKSVGKELLALPVSPGVQCFTVFLPLKVQEYGWSSTSFECQYKGIYLNSPFVKETKWNDFVLDFCQWQEAAQPISR